MKGGEGIGLDDLLLALATLTFIVTEVYLLLSEMTLGVY